MLEHYGQTACCDRCDKLVAKLVLYICTSCGKWCCPACMSKNLDKCLDCDTQPVKPKGLAEIAKMKLEKKGKKK